MEMKEGWVGGKQVRIPKDLDFVFSADDYFDNVPVPGVKSFVRMRIDATDDYDLITFSDMVKILIIHSYSRLDLSLVIKGKENKVINKILYTHWPSVITHQLIIPLTFQPEDMVMLRYYGALHNVILTGFRRSYER